ncbi:MFS transporter [Actinophytocola sediminis]
MWLFSLVLAGFAVQTDDFVIIGVLPAIATGLDVSEAAAGQLVTVFTLVYAIGAPLSATMLARVPRRRLLLTALTVFVAANLAVPAVDGYLPLLALRVLAALSTATVLPAALAVAAARAPAGARGRYLAAVMAGLTGAFVLGVPAGTWVGNAWGWQATFVLGGLLGLAALVAIACWLPADGDRAEVSARVVGRELLTSPVRTVLAVTVLAVAGNLAFQTYLAPVLAGLAGVRPALLGGLLAAAGLAGIAGTYAAGRAIDRWGAVRTFTGAGLTFAASMAGFALCWPARPVPLAVVVALLLVWSASAWAVPPAIQALMLDGVSEQTAAAAMAVNSSTVYLGAALGSAAGGLLVANPGTIPPLAAGCALAAVTVCLTRVRSRAGRRTAA